MQFTDTHAHLDFVEDLSKIISDCKEENVTTVFSVGTSIDCSKKCIKIAEEISEINVYATCGIHPEDGKSDVDKYGNDYILKLKEAATSSSKVVAIGECGLNFYLDSSQKPETTDGEKEIQRELFGAQVKLASSLDLPIIVHCRNAWDEIFGFVSNSNKGVFHSWTGDLEAAKKALDMGFYISFSGIVTFKNAQRVQEVAKFVPLERIIIETDSPFLSPEPIRGAKNSPKNVKITAAFLAQLRNEPIELIAEKTVENAAKLFSLNNG